MRPSVLSILLLAALPTSALADAPRTTNLPTQRSTNMSLKVTSIAFSDNGAIPRDYTCDGREISPPLSWSGVPKDARSIAVLVDDPDAPNGTFTHWLVTGIPPTTRSLPAGGALPERAIEAKNDMGRSGYAGPCPPSGRHHYHFHVYALDIPLHKAMSRTELQAAIRGHILAEGELVGTYQRQARR